MYFIPARRGSRAALSSDGQVATGDLDDISTIPFPARQPPLVLMMIRLQGGILQILPGIKALRCDRDIVTPVMIGNGHAASGTISMPVGDCPGTRIRDPHLNKRGPGATPPHDSKGGEEGV